MSEESDAIREGFAAWVAAYRERTRFFMESTPIFKSIERNMEESRATAEDAFASLGIIKPKVRVRKED